MSPTRVAIVTGAAQGIGRAIALRLARDGLDIVVNDLPLKAKELDSTVNEIEGFGRKGLSVPGDASKEDFLTELVDTTVKNLGSLDVFVANAGVVGRKQILDVTPEDYHALMNVNALGTLLAFKVAARQMIKQGRGGRIIGASSINGRRAAPGAVLYSGSKFFIRGLVQSAAQEWAPHGITVNAYAPGIIDTTMLDAVDEDWRRRGDTEGVWRKKLLEQVPLGRLGTPEDVAGLVSYIASEDGAYITGQALNLNGGWLLD